MQFYGPDAEADPASFDVDEFIDAAVQDLRAAGVGGVVSSSDYPGCLLAAIVADRLGLPTSSPESVLRSSHKYYARLSMQHVIPEATPAFMLIDPRRLSESELTLSFPFFVKPVKSWFSQFARRIDNFAGLQAFLSTPDLESHLNDFVRPFNDLLGRFDCFEFDASLMIAEEILTGHQVTLEGYVLGGRVETLGIVDSILYGQAPSFARFDYPSSIDPLTADRMSDLSKKVVDALGFNHGLFNIEFIHNRAANTIHVVEINPRMCGQFADLMEHVNGMNTYEVLLAIGLGRPPRRSSQVIPRAFASSFALRHFSDAVVVRAPTPAELLDIQTHLPITLLIIYYVIGDRLSSRPKHHDGWSHRYAVANFTGWSHESLLADFGRFQVWLDRHLILR